MTRWILALLPLSVLVGCGSDTAVPTPAPGDSDEPAGDYVSDGLPDPFDEGDVLRVTFRDSEISFQATCNTMSGLASWEEDVLRVSQVGGTEMGCPGAGHEQDEWLIEFFTSRPAIETLDSGFELRGEAGTVRFLRPEAADQDVRLESVLWELTGIEQIDGDAVSMTPVRAGSSASLDVTGNQFVLETGCNTASATVVWGEADVKITEMLVTQRGCRADQVDQERLQLAALDGDLTWSVDGDQLRLGNGRTTLLYRATS